LRGTGWVVPGGGEDWLHEGVPADTAGPRAHALFPDLGEMTVAVVAGERAWLAHEGTGPATCPRCGSSWPDGTFWAELERWFEDGEEPVGSCPGCAWRAPLGDWDVSGSVVVGGPAVVLDVSGRAVDHRAGPDPALVGTALRDELARELGGRWAYVHLHL
jgi:hypothetical protein